MTPAVYLDANATTRPLREVVDCVARAARSAWGNPSSRHESGRRSRELLEASRLSLANALDVEPASIVFTSGATEANHLAIRWAIRRGRLCGRRVVVASPTEHPSVRDVLLRTAARGEIDLRWLVVDSNGSLRPESLSAIDDGTALVTVMAANSETGAVQPLAAVAAKARQHGALVHTDAAQALGRVPVKFGLGFSVDLASVSAHKLHGPRGIGCLVANSDIAWAPYGDGGHQEGGRRPGTEPVALAAGFALAAERAIRGLASISTVAMRRDRLETGLVGAGAVVNGGCSLRLPNTTSVRFPGLDGATLVLALSREGIEVSTGSACLSAAHEPSHVLTAMGLSAQEAKESLRFSLSRLTKDADIGRALAVVPQVVDRVRLLA